MESADTKVFSIIVKIWVEASGDGSWHGRVTHIPSGEQHYVRRVEDIAVIVSRYLTELGIRQGMFIRAWKWVRHMN